MDSNPHQRVCKHGKNPVKCRDCKRFSKTVVETYQHHRVVSGVRESISLTVFDLNSSLVEVCGVLGFDADKLGIETQVTK